MRPFEYKAVPAPTTGTKAKGVKSREDRFALSMTDILNDMAADGWEYVRAEMLPMEERKGLTGTQTTYQNVMIFKRLKQAALTLDDGPRVRSVPSPQVTEDEFRMPKTDDAPLKVVSTTPDDTAAPPVGAADKSS